MASQSPRVCLRTITTDVWVRAMNEQRRLLSSRGGRRAVKCWEDREPWVFARKAPPDVAAGKTKREVGLYLPVHRVAVDSERERQHGAAGRNVAGERRTR